jgi:hypothetical protein
VILADTRHATEPSENVKHTVSPPPFNGEIAKYNGSNSLPRGGLVLHKVGTLRMHEDADGPIYVNHVAVAGYPDTEPRRPGTVEIQDRGSLQIERFSPTLAG